MVDLFLSNCFATSAPFKPSVVKKLFGNLVDLDFYQNYPYNNFSNSKRRYKRNDYGVS